MICIPIVGKTRPAVIKAIERSSRLADMIELRMDLIPNGNLSELIEKSRAVSPSIKILVTNRSPRQSGKILPKSETRRTRRPAAAEKDTVSNKEMQRIAVLKEAIATGCDYVDCELDTADALRNELISTIEIHQNRTKLILSDHHFQATPSLKSLIKLFHHCIHAGADIAKIVTYARKLEDNLRIFELVTYARKKGHKIAAFCMGGHGAASRVIAPLLGSCITYASLRKGAESAPGQLTVKEIKDVFRTLNIA
ncbi:MAG: type I 3-dehydroquinate dehydratase [Deltaproteobacteria bacterium]|nr:type I 3-dehydroquinate dehydratase [Deltaproteobacteria bacterium]